MADDQYNQKVDKLSQAKGSEDKTFTQYAAMAGLAGMEGAEKIGSLMGSEGENHPYLGAAVTGGLLFPKVRNVLLSPKTPMLYGGGMALGGIGTEIYDKLYNKNTSSRVDNFDVTTGIGIKSSDEAKDIALGLQIFKNYRDAVAGAGKFKFESVEKGVSEAVGSGEETSKVIASLKSKIFEAMKSPVSTSPLLYGKTAQEELTDLLNELEKKSKPSISAPEIKAPKKSFVTKAKEAIKEKVTASPKKYITTPQERLIQRGKELEKGLIESAIRKEVINKPKIKLPPKPKTPPKSYSKILSEIEAKNLAPKGSIKIIPSSPEIPSALFPELEQNIKNAAAWKKIAEGKQNEEVSTKIAEAVSKTSKVTFLLRGLAEKLPIISAGLDTAEATRYLMQGDITSGAIKLVEAADQAAWFIPGAGIYLGYSTIPLNYYLDTLVAKQREKFLKERAEKSKNMIPSEFAPKPSAVPTPKPSPSKEATKRYDNVVFPEGTTKESPTDIGYLDNKPLSITLKPISSPTPKPTPPQIPPISIPSVNIPPEEIPVPPVITQTNALETQQIAPKTESTAMAPSSTTVNGGSTTNATIINNNNMSKSIPQIREEHRRHTNTLGAYGVY